MVTGKNDSADIRSSTLFSANGCIQPTQRKIVHYSITRKNTRLLAFKLSLFVTNLFVDINEKFVCVKNIVVG